MTSTDFDSIGATSRLREAGFNADQAQAIVAELHQAATADRGDLATKTDVAAVRTEMKADIAAVRTEMRIFGAITLLIAGKLFGIFNAVAGVLG